ncbi:hypothetical protein EVA_17896 [gut metagenome]|uniref:Uncharacterized protein n=1 Tax=gut metagenome TaxID=749906 RepID=J9FHU3_9ZZZZ
MRQLRYLSVQQSVQEQVQAYLLFPVQSKVNLRQK